MSLLKLPTMMTKMMQLVKSKRPYQVDPWINIAKLLNISIDKANRCTQDKVVLLHWMNKYRTMQLRGDKITD